MGTALSKSQHNLRSMRAVHVPGSMNTGADMLSWNGPSPEEWGLHHQTVCMTWSIFGQAVVDLFASKELPLPNVFLKGKRHISPQVAPLWLYAFPPVALLPQAISLRPSGKTDARFYLWHHSDRTSSGSPGWFNCYQQPHGQLRRDLLS